MTKFDPLNPPVGLLCKIGSIIAHVEECVGPKGHVFDLTVVKELTRDQEVRDWLTAMRDMALLPVSR